MKIHHIGFLTNKISQTLSDFKSLNYKKKGPKIDDKLLMVNIQFIKNSKSIIELVEPYKKNYGLKMILGKKIYAYHFAYKVRNLSNEIKKLKKKNFKLIVNPVPAKAFNNKKIAFLTMKNGFIIELIES